MSSAVQKLAALTVSKERGSAPVAMAMYLEELGLYVRQHAQLETEIAKMAEGDEDCQILMSHPGINAFTSVAIKSRVGDHAKRFPTKKRFCSYAGVVPGTDNSGEHVSDHVHVKHGDHILKYALTCAVSGAVKSNADSTVKKFYLKLVNKRGMDPQKAEVAAARKLACVVWRMLTSKQRYVDENKYLSARKMKEVSKKARREVRYATQPESVLELIKNLTSKADVLESYPEDLGRKLGHKTKRRTV